MYANSEATARVLPLINGHAPAIGELTSADGSSRQSRGELSRMQKAQEHATVVADLPFRVAPHNIEAEQALLGAILFDNTALARVADIVETHHFFDPLHQQIYETAAKLIVAGRRVTPVTIKTYFERHEPIRAGLTVPQYLGRLAAEACTIINAPDYARTIRDLEARRQLILMAEDAMDCAYDSPPDFDPNQQIEELTTRLARVAGALGKADNADGIEYAKDAAVGSLAAYVVKGIFPAASVIAVYGATTVGKTFWIMDGCFCIALGKPFMARRVKQGAVLYVALEGRSGFGKRLAAGIRAHGDPGVCFARFKNLVALGRSPRAEADVARIIGAARALAKQAGVQVSVIVIDTLARALGGSGDDENQAAAISAVVGQANKIAADTGAAVVIAHHPGKDADRGMRGSYALSADFDVIVKLEREAQSDIRHVILEKAKDGEEGPVGSFTLEKVTLGQDEDGDDITSCIVRYLADVRSRGPRPPPPQSQAATALNELDHLLIAGRGRKSRGHDRIPDGVDVLDRGEWRAACRTKGLTSDGDPASEKKAFSRAVEALKKLGCIGYHGEHVWRIGDRQEGGH